VNTKDLPFEGGKGVADPHRKGDWMQCWTGRRFYPADPCPEDVHILDCIFALANKSRYNGHCQFYSVMEHSCLVSDLMPEGMQLDGLTHDFDEVYFPDVHRPAKRAMGKDNILFTLMRNAWEQAICPALNLRPTIPDEVLLMDTQICVLEKKALHPRSQEWDLPYPMPKARIQCWPASVARRMGLIKWCALTGSDVKGLMAKMEELEEQDAHALAHQ